MNTRCGSRQEPEPELVRSAGLRYRNHKLTQLMQDRLLRLCSHRSSCFSCPAFHGVLANACQGQLGGLREDVDAAWVHYGALVLQRFGFQHRNQRHRCVHDVSTHREHVAVLSNFRFVNVSPLKPQLRSAATKPNWPEAFLGRHRMLTKPSAPSSTPPERGTLWGGDPNSP